MGDFGIGSWPARRARISPAATALRQGDRALTYRELAAKVDAVAGGLARRGVRAGDRVAYLGPNDVNTFVAFFASGRLGALFVPLNTRLTEPELAVLVEDCAPAVFIRGADDLPPDDEPPAPVDVGLDDPALLLYTSGTTGVSKGAVLTHGNLTWNTMNQLAHADILSTDVALCTAPLFHVTGLGQVSLPTLFKGGTVVVAPRFEPGWMLGAIAELGITGFSAVPTMLQMLCDHPDWPAADLRSLRFVIYGGSSVQERVARAWLDRGVEVMQGYGMTEAAPGVVLATPEGALDRPVSAGPPHFFTDVALLDVDGTVSTGPGVGELLVHGPNVFAGYWNRPEETAASFLPGRWFRSGDVVRIEDDGWTTVVDRVKDMIISGGENIYPAEVEAVINQLPRWPTAPSSPCPTRGGARSGWPSSCPGRAPPSTRPGSVPTWTGGSPSTKFQGFSGLSRSCRGPPPARCAGKT